MKINEKLSENVLVSLEFPSPRLPKISLIRFFRFNYASISFNTKIILFGIRRQKYILHGVKKCFFGNFDFFSVFYDDFGSTIENIVISSIFHQYFINISLIFNIFLEVDRKNTQKVTKHQKFKKKITV